MLSIIWGWAGKAESGVFRRRAGNSSGRGFLGLDGVDAGREGWERHVR